MTTPHDPQGIEEKKYDIEQFKEENGYYPNAKSDFTSQQWEAREKEIWGLTRCLTFVFRHRFKNKKSLN